MGVRLHTFDPSWTPQWWKPCTPEHPFLKILYVLTIHFSHEHFPIAGKYMYIDDVDNATYDLIPCNFVAEDKRTSIDIFLKAAGYLDCAIHHVLPEIPPETRFKKSQALSNCQSLMKLYEPFFSPYRICVESRILAMVFVLFWSLGCLTFSLLL